MKKKLKPIPKFKTEDEERVFWSKEDSTNYIDWSNAVLNPKFPNLKFSDKEKRKKQRRVRHLEK